MNDQETRAALMRYWADPGNRELAQALYHDDAILEFPQGRERLVGYANIRAMREAYPAEVALTFWRLRGEGSLWISEGTVSYNGGPEAYGLAILEFRGDKIARETIYYGEGWESPAWRAQWVEPMPTVLSSGELR